MTLGPAGLVAIPSVFKGFANGRLGGCRHPEWGLSPRSQGDYPGKQAGRRAGQRSGPPSSAQSSGRRSRRPDPRPGVGSHPPEARVVVGSPRAVIFRDLAFYRKQPVPRVFLVPRLCGLRTVERGAFLVGSGPQGLALGCRAGPLRAGDQCGSRRCSGPVVRSRPGKNRNFKTRQRGLPGTPWLARRADAACAQTSREPCKSSSVGSSDFNSVEDIVRRAR
jgi:hypothetical protein